MISLIEKYASIIWRKLGLSFDIENEKAMSKIKKQNAIMKSKTLVESLHSKESFDIDAYSKLQDQIKFDINNSYVNKTGDLWSYSIESYNEWKNRIPKDQVSMIIITIYYNGAFPVQDTLVENNCKTNLAYQIDRYSWSDSIIFNHIKKISADSKIKEAKSQYEYEFKEAIMEEKRLLITIEDEYKSKRG